MATHVHEELPRRFTDEPLDDSPEDTVLASASQVRRVMLLAPLPSGAAPWSTNEMATSSPAAASVACQASPRSTAQSSSGCSCAPSSSGSCEPSDFQFPGVRPGKDRRKKPTSLVPRQGAVLSPEDAKMAEAPAEAPSSPQETKTGERTRPLIDQIFSVFRQPR
jgi:hypothetical protein